MTPAEYEQRRAEHAANIAAMFAGPKRRMPVGGRRGKPVCIDGRTYPSRTAAMLAAGVGRTWFYRKLRDETAQKHDLPAIHHARHAT